MFQKKFTNLKLFVGGGGIEPPTFRLATDAPSSSCPPVMDGVTKTTVQTKTPNTLTLRGRMKLINVPRIVDTLPIDFASVQI